MSVECDAVFFGPPQPSGEQLLEAVAHRNELEKAELLKAKLAEGPVCARGHPLAVVKVKKDVIHAHHLTCKSCQTPRKKGMRFLTCSSWPKCMAWDAINCTGCWLTDVDVGGSHTLGELDTG